MKWKKIDPDNLPTGEVLAACFEPPTLGYGDKLIGIITTTNYHLQVPIITCNSVDDQLFFCTHYIDIHKHDDERE